MKRACLAVVVGWVALVVGGAAVHARAVLPVEAQAKLLRALKPYALGEPVVPPWELVDIAIEVDRVAMTLAAGDRTATLRLVPREEGGTWTTASFAARLEWSGEDRGDRRDGPRPAVDAILERLRAGDQGNFYAQLAEPPPGTNLVTGPPPEPLPIVPVLFGLITLAAGLMIRDRRALARVPRPEAAARHAWLVALALLAVALALRFAYGAHTLLHENAHGQRLLSELAGLTEAPRPRAGLAGLWALFRLAIPVSIASVAAVNAVIGATWAPLLFLVARSLGQGLWGAAVAGLAIATLPLAVSLSASELSFVPATSFLLIGVWASAVAVRAGSTWWLVAAVLCVAIAGHFRPVMYTAALPVLGAVVLLDGPRPVRARLLSRGPWLAALAFAVAVASDLPGVLDNLGRASALQPGWWNGAKLRNWPLLDPAVTPPWFVGLAVASAVGVLWRGRASARRAVAWVLALGVWLTFFYTAINGWPAAVRYALSNGWVFALLTGFGVAELILHRSTLGRAAAAMAAAGALAAPWAQADWLNRTSAQQAELAWQRDVVLPYLATQPAGTIITPWPELDRMNGTFDAVAARRLGWNVVGMDAGAALLRERRSGPTAASAPILWYGGLTCWVRPINEAEGKYDRDGRNVRCRLFERAARWQPLFEATLEQGPDADWLVLGDGRRPVTIGVFRLRD